MKTISDNTAVRVSDGESISWHGCLGDFETMYDVSSEQRSEVRIALASRAVALLKIEGEKKYLIELAPDQNYAVFVLSASKHHYIKQTDGGAPLLFREVAHLINVAAIQTAISGDPLHTFALIDGEIALPSANPKRDIHETTRLVSEFYRNASSKAA